MEACKVVKRKRYNWTEISFALHFLWCFKYSLAERTSRQQEELGRSEPRWWVFFPPAALRLVTTFSSPVFVILKQFVCEILLIIWGAYLLSCYLGSWGKGEKVRESVVPVFIPSPINTGFEVKAWSLLLSTIPLLALVAHVAALHVAAEELFFCSWANCSCFLITCYDSAGLGLLQWSKGPLKCERETLRVISDTKLWRHKGQGSQYTHAVRGYCT